MKILVINCGSSSIKYKVYEFPSRTLLIKGIIENVGDKSVSVANHSEGLKKVLSKLISKKVISDLKEINAVGHRVVHGGETFQQPRMINEEVIMKIKECSKLAPLHNPANLAGIIGCENIMANVPQVAVFDTAFHQTIPQYAYMYPIPMKYYKDDGVRKYGFHGTSHQFVALAAAKKLGKPFNALKLITCHLGNGCSITAIDKGKSVDTSMGLTPLEGLMMGTRCGDIDVAAAFCVMEKESISVKEMDMVLNRKSGLLGISGISNDIRVIRKAADKGNPSAKLAIEMFMYRIKKYIGAYLLVLGGADAVCFTAGIGENNPDLIKEFKKQIDKLTSKKTKVLVIPTDEELMIASLTHEVVTASIKKKNVIALS